eukprot:3908081-Rhodomonas_salina.2
MLLRACYALSGICYALPGTDAGAARSGRRRRWMRPRRRRSMPRGANATLLLPTGNARHVILA